jgi:hypothetical protein
MKKGQRIKTFEGDTATTDWLTATSAGSYNTYAVGMRWVQKFTGMNGDQILESRKNDKDNTWEKKLLALKQWMKDQGWSDLYARQTTVALRSFFAFYRVKLEMTHQEAGKLRQSRRTTEDYRFSRDDLRRMAGVADVTEKYIIMAGKSFGLRAGDFLRLTRGHFSTIDTAQEPPIFLCEYQTQKEGVTAYPFIDSDAVPAVKAMLEKMDRAGRTGAGEKMLVYKNEVELSRVLKRLADEAGINHGNKIIRFQNLRKFLIDRLSDVMSESKWKQIVGKQISEGAYVSADNLRADYMRAMPETIVTGVDVEERLKKMEAVQRIEAKFKADEPLTTGDYADVKRYGIRLGKRREHKEVRDCADGEHCQKIVGEEELPEMLSGGWHVAAVLPSGKIVVSNE